MKLVSLKKKRKAEILKQADQNNSDGIVTNAPARADLNKMLFLELCDFHNFHHRSQELALSTSLRTVLSSIIL